MSVKPAGSSPSAARGNSAALRSSPATGFDYTFPAIRGIQAGREYYVSMCPLRLLPKIFLFDEEELVPELRAQRTLNKARLPMLVRYILDNPTDYVFSAITASVDAEMDFQADSGASADARLGLLRIPMSARFLINDGQHRRAAIELALRENPDLADESIAVVFFHDHGLNRCQQMFADLNRHAVKPSKAIGVLYDHRDDRAELTRLIVMRSKVFRNVVEMERSTLSARSSKLFTLSSLYGATNALLAGLALEHEDACALATDFWEAIADQFPEWHAVRKREMTASELRQEFLHSHGTALQAIGRVGNDLLRISTDPRQWAPKLSTLGTLDWSRSNTGLWEGRALIGGRVSKSSQNVALTANAIRIHLGLPLAPEDQRIEDAYRRGDVP